MRKKNLLFMAFAAMLILGLASQAGAAITPSTLNLLNIFDTNGDGVLKFGDDGSLDYDEVTSVTRSFRLTEIPNYDYNAVLTVSYTGYDPSAVDSDAHIRIAGVNLGDFRDTENNTQSWSVDINNFVPFMDNSITIYTAYYESWIYDHWEDFSITRLTLTYQTGYADPAPAVPIPGAGILFGLGLAGIAGVSRRK